MPRAQLFTDLIARAPTLAAALAPALAAAARAAASPFRRAEAFGMLEALGRHAGGLPPGAGGAGPALEAVAEALGAAAAGGGAAGGAAPLNSKRLRSVLGCARAAIKVRCGCVWV